MLLESTNIIAIIMKMLSKQKRSERNHGDTDLRIKEREEMEKLRQIRQTRQTLADSADAGRLGRRRQTRQTRQTPPNASLAED